MKDTIINLTPPIDGVQYGYNSEPIKYGDWYISNIETIEQAPFNFKEGLRNVICSTNPKDLRFPYLQQKCDACNGDGYTAEHRQDCDGGCYGSGGCPIQVQCDKCMATGYLQLPSKEQEVDRAADEFRKYIKHTRLENLSVASEQGDAFIAGFNTNKGIYTQAIELLKHYVGEIDEFNSQQKEFGDKVEQFLLSLQPTAKAVRVEIIYTCKNCDCGYFAISRCDCSCHDKGEPFKIKVETSPEYSQGVVKALEVIY